MAKIWKSLKSRSFGRYELSKLVDHNVRNEFPRGQGPFQIICDIDKTYLETKFETFVDIIQVALETATSKQTVEGAADILMASRWGNIYGPAKESLNGLHFVSSSPPQLRPVLEEKLMIDGLEWDTDTFKNQAYNLLKGKVSLLKQHLTYKSSAILKVIQHCPEGSQFIFIGDNAESDPVIYMGVTLYLAGILDKDSYCEYLSMAGSEDQILSEFANHLQPAPKASVSGIIIRNAPGYNRSIPLNLKNFIRSFDHFYETAFMLHNVGVFDDGALIKITKDLHNYYGIDRSYLCSVIEAACLDRDAQYKNVMGQCMQILKVENDLQWKKDLTYDLSPFDFSQIKDFTKEEAFQFLKSWY